MELKDFVSSSINQIIEGVKDAQNHAKAHKAKVSPRSRAMMRAPEGIGNIVDSETDELIYHIKFSVLVTTGEDKNKEGGIGIFVGPVTVGAKGSKGESTQETNRIEFEVPIVYPSTN